MYVLPYDIRRRYKRVWLFLQRLLRDPVTSGLVKRFVKELAGFFTKILLWSEPIITNNKVCRFARKIAAGNVISRPMPERFRCRQFSGWFPVANGIRDEKQKLF